MNSPAQAIAWEIWRKFRWAFLCCAAVIPVAAVVHLAFGRAIPELVGFFEGTAILLSGSTLIIIFAFCEVDEKRRTTGFPTRLFVLPIHTFKLVSLPIIYGVITVICFYFVWAMLLMRQWPDVLSGEQMIYYASVLPAALASLQAIVWSLHRFNWIRALLLFGTAWAWLALVISSSGDHPSIRPSTLTRISLIIFAASFALAFVAVHRERSGAWKGGVERFFQAILDALPWRRKPFTSTARAQFWMEWRRRGWLLAFIFAVQSAGSLVLIPIPVALYLDSTSILFGLSLLPFSMLWFATFVGLGLSKADCWLPALALPTIVAARPILTGDIVFAKLKAAAMITWLGLLLFAPLSFAATQAVRLYQDLNPAVLTFWANFRTDHNLLAGWLSHPVVLFLIPGLVWHGMVAAMAPGLTGNQRKSGWIVAWGAMVFGTLLAAANWFYRHPADLKAFLMLLPAISAIWLAWKWFASARAFWTARQSGIFTPKQFAFLVAAWFVLTGAVAIAAWLANAADQIPTPIILFLAVWLLPGPHMPRCGLNLALNRHR
jgi:hypothetical protein